MKLDLMDEEAKPTRIASKSNFAYDKLARYLGELEEKAMTTQNPLAITEKGRDFIEDYDRIGGFLHEMGVKYLAIPKRETC